MKMGAKVNVWNSGTSADPGDEWRFLCEIPEDLAKHLANPEKRMICLFVKTHYGAKVVGDPVAWRYAKEVE